MAYDPVKNYEVTDVEEVPNGEFVTTAAGETVFVKRPGGAKRYRVRLSGHFISFPEGVASVGETITLGGIAFVVEGIQYSGLCRIKAVDGTYFDGRSYEIRAISVSAHDASPFAATGAGGSLS